MSTVHILYSVARVQWSPLDLGGEERRTHNTGPSGSNQLEGQVKLAQQRWREEEERWRQEDKELVAELAAAQLVEEELAWKAEESQRRQRLNEVEKKWREMEKAKGKKRNADEEDEMDEGSVKKRKEVSNEFYIA